MKRMFTHLLWKIIPKKTLSRVLGKLAKHRISKRVIPHYIHFFNIDLAPVKKSIDEFDHLLDFFIREYRPDARPIDLTHDSVVSPVDGVIVQSGDIKEEKLLQAKGMYYTLDELLGYQKKHLSSFSNGKFITLYLSPRDYHRIHMPVDGFVSELTHIPGQLYPVNNMGLTSIPRLFSRNERIISYLKTEFGEVALIKVGATNVGSIKVNFDDTVNSNQRGKKKIEHKVYYPSIQYKKGEEVARFEFGSTVILLFEACQMEWTINPEPGTYVQMGQQIAKSKKVKWG